MTVEQASEYLGIPVATLYTWRSRGQGPTSVRVGRRLRYRRDALLDWVLALEHQQAG